jgi:hypothetical protein
MTRLTDVNKLGVALKSRIADFKSSQDKKLEEIHEVCNIYHYI